METEFETEFFSPYILLLLLEYFWPSKTADIVAVLFIAPLHTTLTTAAWAWPAKISVNASHTRVTFHYDQGDKAALSGCDIFHLPLSPKSGVETKWVLTYKWKGIAE